MPQNQYIIEFWQVGNSVKVSAIDLVSLTEVSIVGSPKMSQDQLRNAAVQKLQYVLRKKQS